MKVSVIHFGTKRRICEATVSKAEYKFLQPKESFIVKDWLSAYQHYDSDFLSEDECVYIE